MTFFQNFEFSFFDMLEIFISAREKSQNILQGANIEITSKIDARICRAFFEILLLNYLI